MHVEYVHILLKHSKKKRQKERLAPELIRGFFYTRSPFSSVFELKYYINLIFLSLFALLYEGHRFLITGGCLSLVRLAVRFTPPLSFSCRGPVFFASYGGMAER